MLVQDTSFGYIVCDMTIVPLSPSLVAQGILAWRKDRPLSKAAANYLSLMRYLME